MRYIASVLLLTLTAVAHGQVYKWVDAQGKTQFSDQPPPKAKSEVVKVQANSGSGGNAAAPKKQATLAEQEAAFKQRQADKAEAEAKEEKAAQQAQQKEAYCKQLKGQLEGMKRATRLVRYDENGKRTTIGGDERKAETAKVEQEIQQNCQG